MPGTNLFLPLKSESIIQHLLKMGADVVIETCNEIGMLYMLQENILFCRGSRLDCCPNSWPIATCLLCYVPFHFKAVWCTLLILSSAMWLSWAKRIVSRHGTSRGVRKHLYTVGPVLLLFCHILEKVHACPSPLHPGGGWDICKRTAPAKPPQSTHRRISKLMEINQGSPLPDIHTWEL